MELLMSKCRICLNDDQPTHCFFNEFDQGLTLKDLFTNTFGLELDEDFNNDYPTNVCHDCTTVMVDFYNLKIIYEENSKQIKALLRNIQNNSEIKYESNLVSNSTQIGSSIDKFEPTGANNDLQDIKLFDKENLNDLEYEIQTYACNKCNVFCLNENDLNLHMKTQHTLKCKFCDEECYSVKNLDEHIQTHKKYICDVCGAAFIKKSYLNDHKELHSNEKPHVCNYCKKAFKRRTVLIKHKKIHTNPRECVCEICGNAFNTRSTLKTHITLVHRKNEKNYMCLICKIKFPLKQTLIKHIERHQKKSKEFVCGQCPLAYKDKSSLDRHIYVKHSGENIKSICSECGKQYSARRNLLKHQKLCH